MLLLVLVVAQPLNMETATKAVSVAVVFKLLHSVMKILLDWSSWGYCIMALRQPMVFSHPLPQIQGLARQI